MTIARFLPPSRRPDEVVACIGLVSDTHYPLRCETLPPALFEILAGVDLLLHAGDVGELEVLDQLGTIAPVIAVHGNDEEQTAQSTLPYQQVITYLGRRILLWHSHYPNRREELASRVDDAMVPKFQRTIDRAHAAGATIAVFGHWHIPLLYEQAGVTVINPGAIASGNFFTRQLLKSVALLYLFDDDRHAVVHIDLAVPTAPFAAYQQWPASFQATLARFSEPIVTVALEQRLQQIRLSLSDAARNALISLFLPLAQLCWRGERTVISMNEVLVHLESDNHLSPAVRKELQTLLH